MCISLSLSLSTLFDFYVCAALGRTERETEPQSPNLIFNRRREYTLLRYVYVYEHI